MNKIIEVDEENWFVIVEPGVTYQQLQDAMNKKGYYDHGAVRRSSGPLRAHKLS